MAPPVVGVVTIGQSPRTDVMPDIAGRLPPGTRVIERGALDHIGPAELASLAPACGEDLLVTRLRDGTEVTLAEARLTPPLLMPGPLVRNLAAAAAPGGRIARLGVVVPASDQIEPVRADWSAAACEVM